MKKKNCWELLTTTGWLLPGWLTRWIPVADTLAPLLVG